MSAKMKKEEVDLDTTLVQIRVLLKGQKNELIIHTIATVATDFVDWLNNNKHTNIYKRADREKMENKFYMIDDYKRKETIVIEKDSIRYFTIPFFIDHGEEIEWKFVVFK